MRKLLSLALLAALLSGASVHVWAHPAFDSGCQACAVGTASHVAAGSPRPAADVEYSDYVPQLARQAAPARSAAPLSARAPPY